MTAIVWLLTVAAYSTSILANLDKQSMDNFAEDRECPIYQLYNPLGYNKCYGGQFRFDWMKKKRYDSFICLNKTNCRRDVNIDPQDTQSSKSFKRIIGGFEARLGEFPSFVQVLHDDNKYNRSQCGGMLLNRYLVLTAAHCLQNTAAVVLAGTVVYDQGERNPVVRSCHPNNYNRVTGYSDWAILELTKNYHYGNNIQPGCLNLDFKLVKDITCITVGHGRYSSSVTGPISTLKAAVLMNCGGWSDLNRDGIRCVLAYDKAPGGGQVCSGDSGGPLFCYENCSGRPKMYSIGIAHRAGNIGNISCHVENYAFFTDTLSHRIGISKLIKKMKQERLRGLSNLAEDLDEPSGFTCRVYDVPPL